jgi:integrase
MPYEQIQRFIQKLHQQQIRSVAAIALEVTVLTVCSTGEVFGMRWDELGGFEINRVWTIPPERQMKRGVSEHRVPLCDRVIELLKRQKEQNVSSAYVFTGYSRHKPMDCKGMMRVFHKMGYSYSVHAFRSSFRDWAGNETNFAREHIEECLAHKVGTRVERAYRRGDAFEKRREVMDAWAEHCGVSRKPRPGTDEVRAPTGGEPI